ncbi:armadillo-type protein [Lipomyces arxii]|uniref:armadillo-type protein n=1 Tax=Lipomyces arxii TaxID=56418 RepID=UPI0034CFD443
MDESSWNEVKTRASTIAMSSSTKQRVKLFTSIANAARAKDASEDLDIVLHVLVSTYALYEDHASRMAVIQAVQALIESYLGVFTSRFVDLLKSETTKRGKAAADYFVLLEWVNITISTLCKMEDKSYYKTYIADLVTVQATCIDGCLKSSDVKRRRLAGSAERATKAALATVFAAVDTAGEMYLDILASKTAKLGTASLLGLLAGTAAELSQNLTAYQTVKDRKPDVIAFYTREVLGSKVAVAAHDAKALNSFFENYFEAPDLLDLAAPLGRALLRSPEAVLGPVTLHFVNSLPKSIDCSAAVKDHLIAPLLSSFKSSKDAVRDNAVKTVVALFAKCTDEEVVPIIANELLTPLTTSKITAADQRAMYAAALTAFPRSSSLAKTVPAGLVSLAAKEINEPATAAIVNAIYYHTQTGLDANVAVDKPVWDAILKGLTDKRQNLRRYWISGFGELVFSGPVKPIGDAAAELYLAAVPALLETWKEVIANPTATVQSKLVVAGFVIVAICSRLKTESALTKAKIVETALTIAPKPSFLMFDRVYTKLTTKEEQTWAVRALRATAGAVAPASAEGWGVAMLYFITSPAVDPGVRQFAAFELGVAYIMSPEVVYSSIKAGLWRWVAQLERDSAEPSAAITASGLKRLNVALQSITRLDTVSDTIAKDQLVGLVVLAHHAVVKHRVNWIALCQRMKVDPAELVAERAAELQAAILATAAADTEQTVDAGMQAAATLAFVNPDVMAPWVRDMFVDDLSVHRLDGVDEMAVRMWHTPAGVLCVDVLSKERERHAVNKNNKDYATLKWEAEVRAELAKKSQPSQKKLNKDELAKVNEQLAKERVVRDRLQDGYMHVRRGVKLIRYLCSGTANGPEIWFSSATKCLGNALKHKLSLLVGSAGVDAFLELSEMINVRVGSLRRFIGVALLRAIGVTDVPSNLAQESLRDLVVRVLYRLRFLSEQIPLEAMSLVYVLPLLLLVLDVKGVSCSNADERDEQVELAIETLKFHTEILTNTSVPRMEVLQCVITFMKSYPVRNKQGKECLLGICQSISGNIADDELNLLLAATISDDSFVRAAVLEGIDAEFDVSDIGYSDELWIACHDEIELNAKTASSIWDENALKITPETPERMLAYLDRSDGVRAATARAIADALESLADDNLFHMFLAALMDLYRVRAAPPATVYDEFGMIVKSSIDQKDPFEVRSGIAATLKCIAPIFRPAELNMFVRFMIDDGPLGDKEPGVRQEMQEAGVMILDLHAQEHVDALMPILESCLAAKHTGSEVQDRVKECAIILYGTLARHLKDDARLPSIVERLISTLRAPSENVQFAVSESLPPLIKRVDGDKIGVYVEKLLKQLFGGNKYSERRGAAYGLAGIVKGVGISALADYDIMRELTAGLEDKKDPKKRQGVQFGFEILSMSLGRYFEPYVIEIMPLLLNSLGDASAEVREATADAAKEIMKHTTGYGIKQMIPLVLENFNQTQWRSKKGSVEMLGTMAYLDPHQLSESLSQIIPEIVGALNDTHREVRKSAGQSLERFGEVISNPEIQNLVPVLLKAISDPTKYVDGALDSLLKTAFVHYIDAPSLALIVYILHRGLKERSASTKRKACQIVGNMASLTDSKDLLPYLNSLVAELEISMVDPVPATRATASKALGSLVEKLGEERLPDLVPKLLSMLRAEDNDGDRLGAAQALAEVVSGLGVRKLEEIMPVVLKSVGSTRASTRESFMNLMIFLPAAFGNNFAPYLAKVIPPILAGLADEVEAIRETSLRAGRLIVKNYATRAVDLLLPELERGLSDENYRIRLSSIELTGDLLYQITGVSKPQGGGGENEDDDDEVVGKEVHSSLQEVLGLERRDRILSLLYVCRSDVTALVRNAAVEVWKTVVPNTPRTVKEILPTLSQVIMRRLSSADEDQRENASATLGELVKRFGESLLTQFLPTLENGLYAGDADTKQGVCIALTELVEATPVNVLLSNQAVLVRFVQTALVDPDGNVRGAAARAFDGLHEVFGDSAVNTVLPELLRLLQSQGDSEYALAALKEIMATKADVICPTLIPVLLTKPITAFNASAIGSLAEVAGQALYYELPSIIDGLLGSDSEAASDAIDAVVGSTVEVERVMELFVAIADGHDGADSAKRASAYMHMQTYFSRADLDEYEEYADQWVSSCIGSMADNDARVIESAVGCLRTLIGRLPKENLLGLVETVSGLVQKLPVRMIFSMAKGPGSVLPVFTTGLMHGSSEQREAAARGIGGVVKRTPGDVLRPYVTQMTGPLIRTVGERVGVQVKVAIVDSLTIVLRHIPQYVRPFVPQLQRTFAKAAEESGDLALQESARQALDALGQVPKSR